MFFSPRNLTIFEIFSFTVCHVDKALMHSLSAVEMLVIISTNPAFRSFRVVRWNQMCAGSAICESHEGKHRIQVESNDRLSSGL